MIRRAVIQGVGQALPNRCLSNAELAKTVDTSDAWIRQRTGIRQRYIAGPSEKTSDLACAAARAALHHAGIAVADVDAVILATTTPDETFPATATKVQAMLGMNRGFAFDIQAVCSGFIYALSVADSFIRTGMARTILVIGAETLSRLLDWNDRGTCILFGDGAGAVVVQAEEAEESADDSAPTPRGIISTHLYADGRQHDLLYVNGGPSSTGTVGVITMQGREVFRHAVDHMAAVVAEALHHNNLSADKLDWLVPHQANIRILTATAEKLALPPEKLVVTVDQHGNTSAASIPLALATAVADGRIKKGHLLMLEALGGGFTWGAVLVRW